MLAYEAALPGSRAVIGPTSDFFRYFQSPTPATATPAATPTPEPQAK